MRKTRVLVVEDSLTVRKRIVEVLKTDPDLEVVGEAGDGKLGIELCQSLRPDVVTLDMILPIMSGLGRGAASPAPLRAYGDCSRHCSALRTICASRSSANGLAM